MAGFWGEGRLSAVLPLSSFCLCAPMGRAALTIWGESGGAWRVWRSDRGCVVVSGGKNRSVMTGDPGDALKASQHEVQRLLGLCLLRLQAYERLLKALVAQQEFSGSAPDLDAVLAARVDGVSRKTLGMLVGAFRGSYLVTGAGNPVPQPEFHGSQGDASISFRFQLSLPEADFAQAESDLKELVQLRNTLVHNFIEQQEFGNLDGCRRAQQWLNAACDRIGQSYGRLREWAEDMEKTRQSMAEIMRSDEFQDAMIKAINSADPET